MVDDVKARIGFVSGGAGSMPHYNSFLPIVPKEIEIDFQGLELYGKSLIPLAIKLAKGQKIPQWNYIHHVWINHANITKYYKCK